MTGSCIMCDGCGKTVEAPRAQLDGSHWLRITPISKKPFAALGRKTIYGMDFCKPECLQLYCGRMEAML